MSEQGNNQDQTDEALEKRAIYEDLKGERVHLSPEILSNHKWFRGEFHTGAWGGDASSYGGITKDRVRLSMMGKKMNPTVHNGLASVRGIITAVIDPEDRVHIGSQGSFRIEDLSDSTRRSAGRRHKKV